ncbi:two-component system regulatory protein YycI [Pontibacillus salipaludis]|uniref:Regulatory protein YycH-like domain-containing protein n=1 Tax=Pontibacillus salipaludis TaxID=1697394 RepID=A0ABQ1PSD4_9BACI|nr:two-component system regulatory protein YycI [Pontibacillus salipaludis]GGD02415.1 hypothetical protein GCM10011389_07350 [Pontibacillus salipaludis]
MQWGQIKTLFILCFLVLDFFLVYQFINKTEQSQLGVLPDTSIEEQLEAEDIQLQNVPENPPKKTYISAKRYDFKEEDLETLEENDNQNPEVYGNILISEFKEPVDIDLEADESKISSIVKDEILFRDEYQYWGYNERWNVLIFFQLREGDPIYYNQNGVVLAFLNEEKDGISRFTQTHLDEIKNTGEEQDLIKPIQAISTLFDKNKLYSDDTVTKFDIGYYTLVQVPLQNGVQVFSPTWNIHVNEESNYFVNGLEGQYISKDEDEFVNEFIQEMKDSVEKQQIELEQPIRGGES